MGKTLHWIVKVLLCWCAWPSKSTSTKESQLSTQQAYQFSWKLHTGLFRNIYKHGWCLTGKDKLGMMTLVPTASREARYILSLRLTLMLTSHPCIPTTQPLEHLKAQHLHYYAEGRSPPSAPCQSPFKVPSVKGEHNNISCMTCSTPQCRATHRCKWTVSEAAHI